MIVEYLEKMHHLMYEEKIKLEREYQKKEVILNDTLKFINTIEDSLDENFESFTPWRIYHENHSKIDLLKDKQNSVQKEMNALKIEIEKYNSYIAEITEVLEYTRKNILIQKDISDLSEISITEKNVSRETNSDLDINEYSLYRNILDSMIQDLNIIYKKIENSIKFMDVDMVRSRIEFQTLSKQISDSIQKYNKQIENLPYR